MLLKAVRRLLTVAIVLAFLYFLIFRPHRLDHRGRERYPEQRDRREFAPQSPEAGRPHGRYGERGPEPEVACSSQYFADWQEPGSGGCTVRMQNGYPVPDPRCTPGGVNPSITLDVLRDLSWRTREVRNCAESEAKKHVAYAWYAIQKPRVNSNEHQVCELDHLVPLELGGSDGMGNIWPECGPDSVTLNQRYFKEKDHVENYLAEQVKSGRMPLQQAQSGIARDWTQYLNDADLWCGRTGGC